MRLKQIPEDFQVEELIELPLTEEGAYTYYRIRKVGIATLAVQNDLAERLKVTPSGLVFPALKDRHAVAVQYVSVRKRGPETVKGEGYIARQVGRGSRALRPSDLRGNRFTLVVRAVAPGLGKALADALLKLQSYGLPNYFDDQRFGSLTARGFIGKEILKRDAEAVLRMYLAEPMVGDPRNVREFKRLVTSHWGQWGYLLHQAPRPSNFRSVITYLKDHPHDYRKAVNLIRDRLLSIYLAAYQSWVWNHIVGFYMESKFGPAARHVRIMRTRFPLPEPGAALAALQGLSLDLPRLTARYEGVFAEAAAQAFEMEGLDVRDFKARILRRAYLAKGRRSVTFAPGDVEVSAPSSDELNEGQECVTVSFTLLPGQYATLVMKAAASLVEAPIRVR